MTLNTTVLINGPATPQESFDAALRAILRAAGRESEFDAAIVKHQRMGERPACSENGWTYETDGIATQIGQGLPAITDLDYLEGQRLPRVVEHEGTEDEFVIRPVECDAELSWDTSYAHNENGIGCTMLHARALVHLIELLPEGTTIVWQNEYAGTWHEGLQEADLVEFLGAGDSAYDWFRTQALPAIEAHAKAVSA